MAQPLRILVLTLAWRNEDYAEAFVASLQEAADRTDSRIAVACLRNGPEGEAGARLVGEGLSQRQECLIVEVPENLGFAGGMQTLLERVTLADYDMFVLANLDAQFDPDFFWHLTRCAGSIPNWGMLVPAVIGPFGVTVGLAEDILGRFTKPFPVYGAGAVVPGGSGACMVLSQAFILTRIRAFGVVLHPEYHSYYEDQELYLWARDCGLGAYACPQAVFIHVHGGSSDGRYRLLDKDDWLLTHVIGNYFVNRWLYTTGWRKAQTTVMGAALYFGYLATDRPWRTPGIMHGALRRARVTSRVVRQRMHDSGFADRPRR